MSHCWPWKHGGTDLTQEQNIRQGKVEVKAVYDQMTGKVGGKGLYKGNYKLRVKVTEDKPVEDKIVKLKKKTNSSSVLKTAFC